MPDLFSPLGALPKFGAGVGLHRVAWLLEELRASDWFRQLDAVRVTGSNGKGSVCAMLASILRALGVTQGLYTSPHLFTFNERFGLNGRAAADEELAPSLEWLLARLASYQRAWPADRPGAFEAFTALALHYYSRQAPEALVVEAGIGGRYDATRVIPGQWVGLTSLELEHAALLGSRLELIAYDKADLCPEGGTLVTGPLDPEVGRRLRAYCALRGVRLVDTTLISRVDGWRYASTAMLVDLQVEELAWRELEIGLQGRHQVANAIVAITLARGWTRRHRPELGDAAFRRGVAQGLARVAWPGRFQRIGSQPETWVDVGHTPDAMERLVETAREVIGARPVVLVTGVSEDKPAEGILARLAPLAATVVCTRAHHKGRSVASIAEAVARHAPQAVLHRVEQVERALELGQRLASEQGGVVLVAGSLFLAAEAMQAARGRDPQALRFF